MPSSNVKTEAVYSSQNNYGFNKANKTLGNTPGGLNMTRHSTAELAVGELDAQRSSESINADQYLDDSAVQYPDSIGTFADGLKGDIFELFETGAKVLNKSFKLLLPFGSESSGSGATDIMRDIEIRSPLANVTNKTSIKSNSRPTNSKSPFKTAEDAIRMRCSSMWKKETPMNSASEPFLPMPPKNLFPPMPQNNTGIRVKEGVKVQLNKLNTGNGSIQVFLIWRTSNQILQKIKSFYLIRGFRVLSVVTTHCFWWATDASFLPLRIMTKGIPEQLSGRSRYTTLIVAQ